MRPFSRFSRRGPPRTSMTRTARVGRKEYRGCSVLVSALFADTEPAQSEAEAGAAAPPTPEWPVPSQASFAGVGQFQPQSQKPRTQEDTPPLPAPVLSSLTFCSGRNGGPTSGGSKTAHPGAQRSSRRVAQNRMRRRVFRRAIRPCPSAFLYRGTPPMKKGHGFFHGPLGRDHYLLVSDKNT